MAEASVSLDRAGQRIAGRYLVEEMLGQGGMATVYRVLDESTGTRCALKRIRTADSSSLARRQQLLEREYYTLAQLAHPRIIAVYDFGRDESGPFYTMELLDGADLASLGRVPWQRACALLRDVASSLAVLHSRGLLHRDVSARNVRCSASGSAKLIDFGALCSMGLDLEVVGTPPFVAPEAVQMQALDARTDLYALGALAYYLVSGRHAYPARQLRELRDAWRSTPAAVKRLVPDVPAALSELIMELLSLDRGTRPQSAAEIMKRLCSIAQLPMDEDVAVSRAYLAAPALVGREQALLATRKQLLSLARGDGQTLLIEGVPGSGRSRMLDAAVLEGKMLSASVLRAHATDGVAGDWAVARTLTTQLMSWTSERVDAAARLSRAVLSHVVEGLVEEQPTGPLPDRSLLIRELRDFILALAHGQRVLIAVDDVDQIDEPSLALLAALANKTERHPLVLALTARRTDGLPASASMRLLASLATRIELVPFAPNQTEALLRSVFGNVPNLPYVAGHIQRLGQGNPRATMELAEYLVDRGLCRYEDGSWSLPARLTNRDLPTSLAETLEAKLHALSADARALCEVASIAELPAMTVAQLSTLTDGWPPERVFAALSELVGARVLVADAEYYRFSQPGYVSVARALMSDAQRIHLHGRLADQLQTQGANPVLLAHHLLEADRDQDAVRVLENVDSRTWHPPQGLLERALLHAQRSNMAARVVEDLRINLVSASVFALDFETFQRVAPPALANLVAESGLDLYRELTELPPAERMVQALARTQAKYEATPPRDRAYTVDEAIRKLLRLTHSYMAMGLWSNDLELLDAFPDLTPLASLSPAIAVMERLLHCAKVRQRGQLMRAFDLYAELLERIAQPDRAGFEPEQLELIRNVCLFLVGNLEASAGMAKCEERAQQLETDRVFRVMAWRVRQVYALSLGDTEQARKCMRRAELLQLQEGLEQQAPGVQQVITALANVRTDDLLGIEQSIGEVAPLAGVMPQWQPILRCCQAAALRLRGDPRAALETLLPALPLAPPGVHWMFGELAAGHLQILNALGRYDEAVERGREYVEVGARQELTLVNEARPHYAVALAQTGRAAEGLATIQALLEEMQEVGYGGVMLGLAYEAGARICLRLEDGEGFERYYERCAETYGAGNNRVLHLRLAQLRAEADPEQDVEALIAEASDATLAGEDETIYSRIRECVDPTDRARCALTMLLQQTERFSGYWFAYTGASELELRASLPADPEADLVRWVNAWFQVELDRRVEASSSLDAPTSEARGEETAQSARVPSWHRDAERRSYEALLLTTQRDGIDVAIGALVLEFDRRSRVMPNQGLMSQIATLMLGHGDVTAATPTPTPSLKPLHE